MILFIKMSFFHYNITKAFFAINLKGTEYGRSEKSTVLRRIFDKEKSNIFSNDFANGKIDTIMGLATLSRRMRKGCIIKRRETSPRPTLFVFYIYCQFRIC